MKTIIRSFLTAAASLFITSWIVPGFDISKEIVIFSTISGSLVLANWFIKPLFKIIFMPLNLATFGLFSVVINAIILFGINYFLSGINVSSWTFPRFEYDGFVIPKISFGIILTYLISGLVISIVITVVDWLTNK